MPEQLLDMNESSESPTFRSASRDSSVINGGATPQPEDSQLPSEVVFAERLDPKYECPVCNNVMKHPVQFSECGHRCCSTCLTELMKVAAPCPVDQNPINREKAIVDRAYQDEINQLGVKCNNYMHGCFWTGIYGDLQSHIEDCKYQLLQCPKRCGVRIEKRLMKQHEREDCPKREVICEFCETGVVYSEEIEHLNICPKFPVPCPNQCTDTEFAREDLMCHLERECLKQEIPCPFYEAGCEFKCERAHMHNHIKDDPIQHLAMACDLIIQHKIILEEHTELLEKATTKVQTLEKQVNTLDKLYGAQLVWKIDKYSEKFSDAKSGKKSTIYSPPFLTSRHGYKMALSASLYGDGKARSRYISVFICICRGEYDSLLVWPFSHRITFTVIDQCQDPAARRNVSYHIKPNTCKENRPFLGRPSGERSASFGAQKFVELSVVKTLDYIRDDTLYIKCTIDFENMIHL